MSASRYRLGTRPAWLSLGLVLLLIGLALALPTGALAATGWYAQTSGVPADTYLSGVAFVNASDGWAVGYSWDTGASAILATTDGGAVWSAQCSGAIADTWLYGGVAFADASHGWAVGYSSEYGEFDVSTILATTDGGAAWSAQSSGTVPGGWLNGVACASGSDAWAVGYIYDDTTSTNTSLILATTDGGATWGVQSSGTIPGGWLNGVAFANASDGWAVGYIYDDNAGTTTSTILATTDGGATWSAQGSGAIADTWLYGVTFANANDGWAVGDDMSTQASIILATTDGGASWSAQSSGAVAGTQLRGVAFASASDGWAVGDDTSTGASVILATRNGGATWSAQSSGAVAGTGLDAIACASASDAWAVGYNTSTGPGTILATTDGGYPAPTLTGFAPTSGKRGAAVTVTGTSFGARRGTSCVKFGVTKSHKYLSWSNTRIRCRVPVKATFGTLKLTVKTAAGLSNAKHFRVKR